MSVYQIELGEKILDVQDLHVWFPVRRGFIETILGKAKLFVRAVDGISFDLREREIFCLVGESGCGKTTTGKSLLRLVPITKGKALFKPRKETLKELEKRGVNPSDGGWVELFNLPEKKYKPIRRDIQMIYQDPYGSLNPRFRVKDILEEPLLVHDIGGSKEERMELIMKTLERVKLTPASDFVDRYPHQLSGGQRQRVAVARAIISNPRLVVADEPVSMLDVSIRAEILEVLLNLRKELGMSYIFITHDLAIARYICDRIAVMYLGKIVEMGEARELIAEPLHPYTKALIAAIPDPDPKNRIGYRYLPIKGEVPNAINIPPGCRFHPRCIPYEEDVKAGGELKDLCPKREPPLVDVGNGRKVACWLHEAVRKTIH